MRTVRLVGLALVVVSALEAGAPAHAKSGVRATITSGLPTTASPGSRIRVEGGCSTGKGIRSARAACSSA